MDAFNPLLKLDYPDPDVIRVRDTYYMVSTTMYFMPGCEILRSYDLINWEHAVYVYDRLDSTPGQRLEGKENIYGQGMWAACLRYHKDKFYVCFVANDTRRTYLYTARTIEGPWEKGEIEGFYHDCSMLFDNDGRVYIASGNKDIRLVELKEDLSGPKEGGIDRIVVSDAGHPGLGYEGTHFYKINGKYYLFFIHSLRERWRRVEACFVSDSLEGEFTGGDVLNDDMGYCDQGVAQGGIVDTPDGKWYGVLFQDRGASGRMPVLVPVEWKDGYPVFGRKGKVPPVFETPDARSGYRYRPLVGSDDFRNAVGTHYRNMAGGMAEKTKGEKYGCFGLKSMWQFNHEPDLSLVRRDADEGILWLQTGTLCGNLTQAVNTLTQRMLYPGCSGEVTVDAGGLKEGDYAGLCALQGCYGMAAVTRRDGELLLVMQSRDTEKGALQAEEKDSGTGKEWETVPVAVGASIRLKVEVDFTIMKDEARFFYLAEEGWRQIGPVHKLYFKLDHFTGCRFGLFLYATRQIGGRAGFQDFQYRQHFSI